MATTSNNIDHRRQEVQQIVKNACDQLNAEGVDARNYVEQLAWLFFLKAFDETEARKEQEAVLRQLEGLVSNTMRSVQALEGKLTSDEQSRILAAMDRAKKARPDSALDDLKSRLAEMERAASLIGQAMLRP